MAGLRFIGVQELEQREAQQASLYAPKVPEMSLLAAHISKSWESNKRAKMEIMERLLDCLRRREGVYSPEKLQEIKKQGASEIYMMLCATKIRAAASWIRDILIPPNGRPWGLNPANVPDVDETMKGIISQAVFAKAKELMSQKDVVVSPQIIRSEIEMVEAKAKEKIQEKARQACDSHEEVIEDQLEQGDWTDSFEGFIDDFSTFPTAILKGPFYKRVATISWQHGKPVISFEAEQCFERVSPFDVYPSVDSSNCQDGSNLIEHIRYSRRDLYDLIGVNGYDEKAIRAALKDYGQGGLKHWMWNEGERNKLENKQHAFFSDDMTIDGLHYWGSAQGQQLLQWGVPTNQVEDVLAEYEVDAILIGNHVIRCVINDDPLNRRPYCAASYQNTPGSFWGKAVPELMSDIEDMCNSTARALQNNMAFASGPMMEVNYDRLAEGEDPTNIYPWKAFQTKASQLGANDPAIRFFNVSSHASELLTVFKEFELRADDATNIPRYAYGNEKVGGAGSTLGGLSMLMESANKGIKAAIGRVDRGVIRPVIQKMFFNNMLYHEDESIKFDARVIAKGSSSMITRERNAQMKREFFQIISNPMDSEIMGVENRARLLRELAEDVDLASFIPNENQIKKKLEAQKQQPSPQMIESQLKGKELELKAADSEKDHALKEKKLDQDYQLKVHEIQSRQKDQPKLPPRVVQ